MIEDFSAGYYYTSMYIEEIDGEPTIARDVYDFIQSQLFMDASDVFVRVGLDSAAVIDVHPENGVPRDVLTLPPSLVEQTGESPVFILKENYIDTVGTHYVNR